ncbi:MAG: acyl carrier protein [Planctomycetota bacterium]
MNPEPSVSDRGAVIQELRRLLVRDYGAQPGLLADAPLVSTGLVDSAGVADLIDWLETRYGVRIEDDEVTFENFETLEALALLVERSRRAAG